MYTEMPLVMQPCFLLDQYLDCLYYCKSGGEFWHISYLNITKHRKVVESEILELRK